MKTNSVHQHVNTNNSVESYIKAVKSQLLHFSINPQDIDTLIEINNAKLFDWWLEGKTVANAKFDLLDIIRPIA